MAWARFRRPSPRSRNETTPAQILSEAAEPVAAVGVDARPDPVGGGRTRRRRRLARGFKSQSMCAHSGRARRRRPRIGHKRPISRTTGTRSGFETQSDQMAATTTVRPQLSAVDVGWRHTPAGVHAWPPPTEHRRRAHRRSRRPRHRRLRLGRQPHASHRHPRRRRRPRRPLLLHQRPVRAEPGVDPHRHLLARERGHDAADAARHVTADLRDRAAPGGLPHGGVRQVASRRRPRARAAGLRRAGSC